MERKIISRKRRLRSRRRLPGMAAPQKILAARPEAARNRRGARSRAVITAKSEQSRVGQTLACLTLSRSTESEINRSPDANARFDPDAPIMALDYLLDDGQANSNSAAEFLALVQPPEDAEDRLVMSLRNPYTVIADVKDRGVGGGEWGVVESERRRQGSAFFPFSLSHLPPPHSLFSPPSSHPISIHFRGLSLYLIALTIKLWKISPTRAWSARTIGNRCGRRISAQLSCNRGAIISSVSLTTSSRSTSCMARSARPTREK